MLDKLVLPFLLLPPMLRAILPCFFLPSENQRIHPNISLSPFFNINALFSDLFKRELNSSLFLERKRTFKNSHVPNLLILSNHQVFLYILSNRRLRYRILIHWTLSETRSRKGATINDQTRDVKIRRRGR